MTQLLKPIPCDEFNTLYDMLEQITIPLKNNTNSRGNFGIHRSMTMGVVRGRFNGIIGLSQPTKKYPHIYKEVVRIGKLIGGKFDAMHINKNVICPPHLDSKNVGDSVLVSFGDYSGCNIVVDDVVHDAFCQPIKFNGSKLVHWNTNDLMGTKYSLVYYTHNLINKLIDKEW